MPRKELSIALEGACLDHTSAILDRPTKDERYPIILLAHGAGLGMTSTFMVGIASALVARGFAVMRFNYAYQEKKEETGGKRPPERKGPLVKTHRAALAALTKALPGRPVIFAGKSMGSRMGSYLAAEGSASAGLVMFGYPLHPSGRPEKLRVDQFPSLRIPALFIQGTRDKLADLDLLRAHLGDYCGDATLHVVEGANHDFQVLKRQNRSHDEVLAELADCVAVWADALA